jgi:hypothetical protein
MILTLSPLNGKIVFDNKRKIIFFPIKELYGILLNKIFICCKLFLVNIIFFGRH